MQDFIIEWYKSLPIVTKVYTSLCCLTTLAVYLDLISFLDIYLNFDLVWKRMEIWRLLTSFFFFGEFGLGFIFHMSFLALEESVFRNRTADFFYLLLFGVFELLAIGYLLYYFKLFSQVTIFGPSLALMIVYVWARHHKHATLNFLGLFTFTAPYLPWAFIALELVITSSLYSIVFDLLGIVAGHTYYYLKYVYPEISGRHWLDTPKFIEKLFDEHREEIQQES